MAGKTAKKVAVRNEPTIDTNPKPAADTREPHEINSALGSDRMKALLEDHRRMGARPK